MRIGHNAGCGFIQYGLKEKTPKFYALEERKAPVRRYILGQCFSTAGPRPGTGPLHQLYRAARGSPGNDNLFKCNFIFVNMPHRTHKCTNILSMIMP